MRSVYKANRIKGLRIQYLDGQLERVRLGNCSMVDWEGIRHFIHFYEERLNKMMFKKISNGEADKD